MIQLYPETLRRAADLCDALDNLYTDVGGGGATVMQLPDRIPVGEASMPSEVYGYLVHDGDGWTFEPKGDG